MKTRFTKRQNKILTEIYRRLNYFHKGDLNIRLLYLSYPNDAKPLVELGLIKPISKEHPRQLNYYNLTIKGKTFFSNYIELITEKTNLAIFNNEIIKTFDFDLL